MLWEECSVSLLRPLRILHLLNHVRETGNGIVNATIDLACTQARLGHSVAVASAGGDFEHLLANYGVKHYRLNQQRSLGNLLKAMGGFDQLVRDWQPDLVHAHMMTGLLLAYGYRQYLACQRRVGSYGQFKYREEFSPKSYALVSTVHNEFQRNATLMGLADKVIGVSQAVVSAMHHRGLAEGKLQLVLNGTLGGPRQQDISQATLSKPLQTPAIVTVAGMYKRKGITDLIEAFRTVATLFPELHLYIVGDGPDRTDFERQAQAIEGGDRIHFEGFQLNPQAYMRQADIFVLASHREPFGLVLTEARAAGCAIVATLVDGIPEALDHGRAGLLVPPKDPWTLAKVLLQLLCYPEQAAVYRQRAKANLERFEVRRVAEETLSIYGLLCYGP